ncbi:MAG TPA: molybdenum cofactor biosynthesis protein MoaE [Planctomicrobium sp.]|nr:molybdenum cofactor biosynthesis protein MoaE [Planctomicrobium sp.]
MDDYGLPSPNWIGLTSEPIDVPALLEFVNSPQAGAVVLFLGTVREMTQGRRTIALDYEAFPEMALSKMEEIIEEARVRWPVVKVAVEHRTGHLGLTECSVAIAVSSPHRQDAFDAGKYLIDELKTRVPIWKKENWDDGTTEWIHPGLEQKS